MQQVFPCPRCGYQSAVGVRFCETCGTKFQYKCLRCDGIIDPTFRFCPDCCTRLEWPEPQNTQPIPMGQNTYYEPQSIHRYGRGVPQYKEKSSSPIKYLGLILGIVLIVAGGIFVANTSSSRQSSPAPPITSKPPVIPPAQKDSLTGTGTLPEYIQQYTNKQPPYIKSPGKSVYLVNNPVAKDVSFAELKSFILQDKTDDGTYIEGIRMCGDFAETLHNNAEQAGIKAAFVAIELENDSIGHALDAFQTTDQGLVYIDCTGRTLRNITYEGWLSEKLYPCEIDRVAYVEKGKEYGVISIDKAEQLNYSCYVEYKQNLQRFKDIVTDFQSELDAYDRALGGRTTLAEPEYSKFKTWLAKIEVKRQTGKELLSKLGYCIPEPLGIVRTVKIYW